MRDASAQIAQELSYESARYWVAGDRPAAPRHRPIGGAIPITLRGP